MKKPNGSLSSSLSLACFVGVNFLVQSAYAQTSEPAKPDANAAAAQTLPEVKVEADVPVDGYQGKPLASPKVLAPRVDTPQSVTVVLEKLMRDQGVTSLRDALRDVSGLSLSAGEGGVQGDNLTLRGFSARSDMYLDGMRDFGSYTRDSFNLEQVEVLKGPSSALFGRGSTGGIVNQVSKSPKDKDFAEGTFTLGNDNTRRATADLNKPLGSGVAFRLNLVDHFSNVAGRDVVENRRFGIAPSLIFGLGQPTRYTVQYLHQSQNDIPDYGIPYVNSRPADVDRANFYGFEDGNYLKAHVEAVTFRVEHDFSKNLTLRNQLRNARYERRFQISQARVPATVVPGSALEGVRVARNQIAGESVESSIANDLSLNARFETGFIRHSLLVGAEAAHETSRPKRYAYTAVPETDLLNPSDDEPFSGTATISSRVSTKARSTGIYLADAMNFGDSWILNLGVRQDTIKGEYKQAVGTLANLSRTDKEVSYRGGITFKPSRPSSIYVNYGTSFNPSIENLSLAANTANLDPEKSKTLEFGTKVEMLSNMLILESAVFRMDKYNARTPDRNDSTLNVLDGEHRVDGAEISLIGRPTARWEVSSGYTHLIAKIKKSNRVGEDDRTLTNTPKNSGNLWASYLLSDHWDIGAGLTSVSSRMGSTVVDAPTGKLRKVHGYTTVNAMAKYRVNDDMDMQLNVLNIADKEYIDAIHPSHLMPGAGRTILLTTGFRVK